LHTARCARARLADSIAFPLPFAYCEEEKAPACLAFLEAWNGKNAYREIYAEENRKGSKRFRRLCKLLGKEFVLLGS